MLELEYKEITSNNLEYATKIQNEIFVGEESAYQHYKYTIDVKIEYNKYFLVYLENKIVGITGFYSNEEIKETNSLWLGWFGVLKEHRSRGIGRKILLDTIDMAKKLSEKYPIKYFRLYTSENYNISAKPLYDDVMELKEYYNNPEDINYDNTCIIYTKSLFNDKPVLWDNKFINLKNIIEETK